MSNSSFPPLFLRFHHRTPEDLIIFKGLLRKLKCKYIMCEEIGEQNGRAHTHSLLFVKSTIDALRKKIRLRFPNYEGNTDFAIKTIGNSDGYTNEDIEKLERYICKGDSNKYEYLSNPKVDFLDYDYFLIEQRHKEYWEKNEEITLENKIKKEKRTKKEKTKTWTENLVEEWIKSEEPKQLEYTPQNKKIVLDFVLTRFRKDIKGFDKQILLRACNAIWATMMTRVFTGSMFVQVYPEDEFYYNQYMG